MNKKSINEIKKQYPSLQKWEDNYAFELYKKIQEHQIIKEFLYTVDPEITLKQVIKQAGYGIIITKATKKGIVLTFGTLNKDYLDKVNKVMNSFGWYPSYISYSYDEGKYSNTVDYFIGQHNVDITYDAKYDQSVDVTNMDYLYHITPDLKWPKIKSLGLTPKTQGKLGDHPGRIYLLTNINNLEDFGGDIMDVSFALYSTYTHKEKVKEMYVLKIDNSQLKNHIFFEDPKFFMGEAVWTYQNIPPSAISLQDKIPMIY